MEKEQKQVLSKCRSDLKKEGILKSVLCGLIVAFSVCFIIAFATWFTDFNGLWLSIGALVVVSAIAIPLFYRYAFLPTDKRIAVRMDRMGFDERLITMYELKDDESYIAKRQREDTVNAIFSAAKNSGGKLIKFKIATAIIVCVAVIGALGIAMTTVTGLSAYGVLAGGKETWNNTFPPHEIEYTISYVVEEGGYIDGTATQKVKVGADGSLVVAMARSGYAFDKWVDESGNEYYNPSRYEANVRGNIVLTAEFIDVDDVEDDPLDSDEPNEDPNGDGDGNDGWDNEDGNPGDDPPLDDSDSNMGGGGGTDQYDQILDGQTPYQEKYDGYYQDAMDKLSSGDGDDIPPELREIIEGYFDILS